MSDRETRIAKRLVADYGDTMWYFNAFDFFQLRQHGGAELESLTNEATAEIDKALEENSRAFDALVKRSLQRRARELAAKGLVLK
jgi:hypothetical protein